MKAAMGLMPELDMPRMIAGMMGAPDQPALGWAVHLMIGILGYGLVFAVIVSRLPAQNRILQGVALGVVGWLMMMVALMPMAGVGMFGLALGLMAPAMTLMLHLMFGAILGGTYRLLEVRGGIPARVS